jgi:hypothetical protein
MEDLDAAETAPNPAIPSQKIIKRAIDRSCSATNRRRSIHVDAKTVERHGVLL